MSEESANYSKEKFEINVDVIFQCIKDMHVHPPMQTNQLRELYTCITIEFEK